MLGSGLVPTCIGGICKPLLILYNCLMQCGQSAPQSVVKRIRTHGDTPSLSLSLSIAVSPDSRYAVNINVEKRGNARE